VETFDVANPLRLDFNGGNVTIDPTDDLVGGVEYYVLIDPIADGEFEEIAIEDTSLNAFAGIRDSTTWSFTADGTAPESTSMSPMADASEVSPFSDLALTFGEAVKLGAGTITVHLAGGGVVETIEVLAGAVTIDGAEVSIDIGELPPGGSFYVTIEAGAFTDFSDNTYSGISDPAAWAFTAAAIPEGLLFSNDFGGDISDLDGTTPDVTTGGAAWVASPNFNQDGSIDEGAGSATLAFTPFNDLVYTLEASLRGVSGDGDWFALGFANGQSTGSTTNDRFINNNVVGRAWMLLKGDASTSQNSALMDGTASNEALTSFTNENPGGDMDMRIVLDTTGGAGTWTATWFAKRPADEAYTEVRATAALLSEDINSVGLALSNAGVLGTIESFRLFTGAAPIESFAITEIVYSADGMASLTWDSIPDEGYLLKVSRDLSDWSIELDDNITAESDENPDDGNKITVTIDLGLLGLNDERLFFRIER
jgi:hypothetical protein